MGSRIITYFVIIVCLTVIHCKGAVIKADNYNLDLTYDSILDKNNSDDKLLIGFCEISKEIRIKTFSFVRNFISEIKIINNKSLESYFYFEILAPHAGEPILIWVMEINSQKYLINFINGKIGCINNNIRGSTYNKILDNIFLWEQSNLNKINNNELKNYYIGIVKAYRNGQQKQFKLTYDELSTGRIRDLLDTIIIETNCSLF